MAGRRSTFKHQPSTCNPSKWAVEISIQKRAAWWPKLTSALNLDTVIIEWSNMQYHRCPGWSNRLSGNTSVDQGNAIVSACWCVLVRPSASLTRWLTHSLTVLTAGARVSRGAATGIGGHTHPAVDASWGSTLSQFAPSAMPTPGTVTHVPVPTQPLVEASSSTILTRRHTNALCHNTHTHTSCLLSYTLHYGLSGIVYIYL